MNLAHDLATLPTLSVAQLRTRFAAAFGERTNAAHKAWLIKRIAWRLQALAEGDLSERARQRAAELANDADLRLNPPKLVIAATPENAVSLALQTPVLAPVHRDHRLPPPGSTITRLYKGQPLQVSVLQNGFAYDGQVFASLSAVAQAVTGSHCNGFHFFRLTNTGDTP